MICAIPTVGGIKERICIKDINQFASCKTV